MVLPMDTAVPHGALAALIVWGCWTPPREKFHGGVPADGHADVHDDVQADDVPDDIPADVHDGILDDVDVDDANSHLTLGAASSTPLNLNLVRGP